MDVRRLLIFRAVAHAGSIAGAARELGWTQPAVSQHLRGLEREVGAPLVVRRARGIDLTEAGRVALEHAEVIAARLHTAEAELASLADMSRGTVRLASFPSASAAVLPPALVTLARRFPGLEVHLTEAEPPDALALLRSGAVDLALVFGYPEAGEPDLQGLESHPLGVDPVDVVVPAGHPLATGRRIDLASLAGEHWVAGCVRCREHLLSVCGRAGFVPTIRHSTDDYVVAQSLVAQGLAVTLLPRLALTAYRHPGVATPAAGAAGSRTLGLVHYQDADRTPAVATVVEAVGQACRAEVTPS